MNIKMIGLGAIALASIAGSAFASSATPEDMMNDSAKMAPFYTDSTMKTLRSDDEVKAGWSAMSKDEQDVVRKGCHDEAIAKKHNEFCTHTMKLDGAK